MTIAEAVTAEPPPELGQIFRRQRAAFAATGAPDLGARRAALKRLERLVLDNREAVADAIAEDFGHRSRHETALAEIFLTVDGLRHAGARLRRWMRPRRRAVSWPFLPARARVIHQPLGVVGIIAPWNYPFNLALAPLTGALAAGNRVMIKPSELTPATSALLARLLGQGFERDEVAVVTGGPEVGKAFAALPFDHLMFTGSTAIGVSILHAAADNLTPVTLELGGKSPAIVAEGYPLERAALKIMAGKLFNAGQTCIAPDYVLIPKARLEDFVAAARDAVAKLYPTLAENPDYTAIVNQRHYRRLAGLVEKAREGGARVVEINPAGESLGPGARKFPPTLVVGAGEQSAVMSEEIFGPVLPIVPYGDLDQAIDYVNARPRPLALYHFDDDRGRAERVLRETTSGGAALNDTLLQTALNDLPFGGVGASGMGAYHGRDGFETFSHKKSVFAQSRLSVSAMLSPPFGRVAERMLRLLIRR